VTTATANDLRRHPVEGDKLREAQLYGDRHIDDGEELFDEPPDPSAHVISIRHPADDELTAPAADLDDDGAAAGRHSGDLDWQDHGLCKQSDPEAFFPEKGGSTKQAKAVCKRCPITDECLRWALDNRERYGIWGGKSEYERRLILIAEAVDARALGRVG